MDLSKLKMSCSYFAVWGNRTENNQLYTARNLDWDPDTGIDHFKMLTIYNIPGKIPYATLGFASHMGALAGMSAAGLTVHETGNDVYSPGSSFSGFPWVLRLRYIMENAHNINEAMSIWDSTNNTMGMNHMISSSEDVPQGHPARALETMGGYTAVFLDNDPREASLTYTDPHTNQITHLGAPLPNAVWRTNHAYDPTILAHQIEPDVPNSNTQTRYNIMANAFRYYESIGKKITFYEAVNITSIVADKGHNFFECPVQNQGKNVISVVFQPEVNGGVIYSAWGNGDGPTWRPAACNPYLVFNMADWWNA